jgi:hypothetical protein
MVGLGGLSSHPINQKLDSETGCRFLEYGLLTGNGIVSMVGGDDSFAA